MVPVREEQSLTAVLCHTRILLRFLTISDVVEASVRKSAWDDDAIDGIGDVDSIDDIADTDGNDDNALNAFSAFIVPSSVATNHD